MSRARGDGGQGEWGARTEGKRGEKSQKTGQGDKEGSKEKGDR